FAVGTQRCKSFLHSLQIGASLVVYALGIDQVISLVNLLPFKLCRFRPKLSRRRFSDCRTWRRGLWWKSVPRRFRLYAWGTALWHPPLFEILSSAAGEGAQLARRFGSDLDGQLPHVGHAFHERAVFEGYARDQPAFFPVGQLVVNGRIGELVEVIVKLPQGLVILILQEIVDALGQPF